MSINDMDNIQLDTHYTRSINLERDADSRAILEAYIPTSRALQTLDKIAGTFTQASTPRAWSLVGPYGAGKSSFAVFLAHLLETQNAETKAIAQRILKTHNTPLAEKIIAHTDNSKAYCIVLLTGSPESLSQRFIDALHQAAVRYWDNTHAPAIVQELDQARLQSLTTSRILELLKKLQQAVSSASGKGILIVIDELGKFLEYEARHQGNDIFLLQTLAETASQDSAANILLVVLMHQAFENYAKGLGEELKNEWSKVQGRFESIPFLESAEQTLHLIAKTFRNRLTDQQQQEINRQTADIVSVLQQQQALLPGLSPDPAIKLLSQCYPLHPIAALILPTLCQKVAQNERTLFGYLGSQEYFGFKHSIERLTKIGDWVLPWEIFEYFIQNQPLATTDHFTHRRWAEVLSAIERLGDADEQETQLLKTIGLFNIIGSQSGFKASHAVLKQCFPATVQVDQLLANLQRKSIINYRKFSAEYRIWEGSDFDLTLALQETIQQLGRFNLAETLSRRNKLAPIVARKYSIQNGTLRVFSPFYVDTATKKEFYQHDNQPRILFFLAENQDDNAVFDSLIKADSNPLNIYVRCSNAAQLKAVVAEAIALETIQSERAEIKSDPVAQRELKDRLSTTRQSEAELLSHAIEQPETNPWFWRGEPLALSTQRDLQNQLSTVLESVYHQAPLIKNELVNRNKVSGQANGAKNKLIAALLSQAHVEDLGFAPDKYPAEKTIYRAVFKEPGLHVERNGVWQLVNPSDNNRYQFAKVWSGISQFLAESNSPKKLTDLYALIEKPPFGVQKGVSPLLFIAYYLANQRTLALYESGVFCPVATQELFEILAKRPELFSIEAIDLSGIRAELFNSYLEKIIGKIPEQSTLLDIVKPLAKFIAQLPQYTLSTKNLEPKTIAVRDAFQSTQSPVKLLFEILPKACGFDSYNGSNLSAANTDDYLNELAVQLKHLNQAYDKLLETFKGQLALALELPADKQLSELRAMIQSKYAGLEHYTPGELKTFIERLQGNQNNKDTDSAWLESIAAFLSKAQPKNWQKSHHNDAENRLSEFSQRLQQSALAHSHQLKADKNNQVTVFRVVTQNDEKDQIAYLNPQLIEQAKTVVDAMPTEFKNADKQMKLAIIAQLMNELD